MIEEHAMLKAGLSIIEGSERTIGSFREFVARDTRLERDVTVRFLDNQRALDKRFKDRFVAEAQKLSGLGSHKNIITIYALSPEEPYFVCERMEQTLEALLMDDEPSPAVALDIVLEIFSGLDFLHRKGIVHLDLSNRNIFTQDLASIVKVGSLGAGAALGSDEAVLTTAVRNIAPELARSEGAGAYTDVYMAGFIAYEMLAGSKGFRDALPEIADTHDEREWKAWHASDSKQLPPLSTVRPDVSEALSSVVMRMVDKDPQIRYTSASEALDALRSTLAETPAVGSAEPAKQKSSKRLLAMGLGSFLVISAILGWLYIDNKQQEQLALEQQNIQAWNQAVEALADRRGIAIDLGANDPEPLSALTELNGRARLHIDSYDVSQHDSYLEKLSEFHPQYDEIAELATQRANAHVARDNALLAQSTAVSTSTSEHLTQAQSALDSGMTALDNDQFKESEGLFTTASEQYKLTFKHDQLFDVKQMVADWSDAFIQLSELESSGEHSNLSEDQIATAQRLEGEQQYDLSYEAYNNAESSHKQSVVNLSKDIIEVSRQSAIDSGVSDGAVALTSFTAATEANTTHETWLEQVVASEVYDRTVELQNLFKRSGEDAVRRAEVVEVKEQVVGRILQAELMGMKNDNSYLRAASEVFAQGETQLGAEDYDSSLQSFYSADKLFENAIASYSSRSISFVAGSDSEEREFIAGVCSQAVVECQGGTADEEQTRNISLTPFTLDSDEITVRQFKQFIQESGYQTTAESAGYSYTMFSGSVIRDPGSSWRDSVDQDYSVVRVTAADASAYCAHKEMRLPSEDEWEFMARTESRMIYPWGNEWQEQISGQLSKVERPAGAYTGLAGGVWDMTLAADGSVVAKGGSGAAPSPMEYRSAYRLFIDDEQSFQDLGFRCAKSVATWGEK